MAGAGYKLFATGDVLTAAQVNTYLNEQTVMVFADSAARTTALSGVLAEGMMSYLQDTNAVEVYTGSAWVAVGGGGLTSPLTTKGDIWVYGTGDTRLPVGTDGHTLVADSVEATGLKWAAPAGGGKVLQVVSASVTTSTTIATTTYTDTNLTASITPSSASSQILVLISNHFYWTRSGTEANVTMQLLRDATAIGNINGDKIWGFYNSGSTSMEGRMTFPVMFLDSPSTTSSTTYKTQAFTQAGTSTNWNNGFGSTITLLEIGA